jgi:hypothetical protein
VSSEDRWEAWLASLSRTQRMRRWWWINRPAVITILVLIAAIIVIWSLA